MSSVAPSPADHWAAFTRRVGEIRALDGVLGMLEWDQQVMMPRGSGPARAQQTALLSEMHHARVSSTELGDLAAVVLEDATCDLGPDLPDGPTRAAAARAVQGDHRRACAVPAALVSRLARARSVGFQTWRQAREADDFALFAPALDDLLSVVREQAACHDVGDHPYDAALEEFDPGSRVAELQPMFTRLGEALVPLVQAARQAEGPAPLPLHVTNAAFAELNQHILQALGYDFDHGRLDLAAHPFSVGIHPLDVRITTRYRNDAPLSTLGATIHECGHALYEQGLPVHLRGTGLAQAAGAGMHESQSRFWENQVGRSLPFFRWVRPALERAVGHSIDPDALYAAANRIEPGLIRVEADEATYNLHVIVRFELELGIFEGRLTARDLPDAWNAGYARWLGVEVPDMRTGVLQDIHWASGLFGYFPSYTLGNLYAAGYGAAVESALPDLWTDIENGRFSDILDWLRAHVHRRGREDTAPRIFADAVGDRDPVADLVDHLYTRQGALYGIQRPA